MCENLELCFGGYSESYIKKVLINKQEASWVYDRDKGLKNNYIVKLNLKTSDFSILYYYL